MRKTLIVVFLVVMASCLTLWAQKASASKDLWSIASGQIPGDRRNAEVTAVADHAPSGAGPKMKVTVTDAPGWVGEWLSKPTNWSGFGRITLAVFNSNDADVSVYFRIKTLNGAVSNSTVDLPPGLSTQVFDLTDLNDSSGSGKPVQLAEIKQWSMNWNFAIEKPLYISSLRLEPGSPAPAPAPAPVPTPAAPAPVVTPKAAPVDPLPTARTSAAQGTSWSSTILLSVLLMCVTAIIIAVLVRQKKA